MPLAAGVCNLLVVLPVPPALTNLPEVVVFQYLCLVVSPPFPTSLPVFHGVCPIGWFKLF